MPSLAAAAAAGRRRTVESELRLSLEDVFVSVDLQPLATASIAQVAPSPRFVLPAVRVAGWGREGGCGPRGRASSASGTPPPPSPPHRAPVCLLPAAWQVHAAVLRGSNKEVVIKVLKPGVEDVLTTGGCWRCCGWGWGCCWC